MTAAEMEEYTSVVKEANQLLISQKKEIQSKDQQIKVLTELVEGYHRICGLLMSIHFHGNLKPETANERELNELLKKNGYYAESEDEVVEKLKQSYWQKYTKP